MENDNKNDAWMLAEDIPNLDFFFAQIWIRAFANDMENSVGRNYAKVLGVFLGTDMKFYYGKNDCQEFTMHVLKLISDDPGFGHKINENIVKLSDEMNAYTESKIYGKDLAGKSNAELWSLMDGFLSAHTRLYGWGWLSNATDMFFPEYTNLLKEYLRKKATSESEINTWMVSLTTSDTESEENVQQKAFLRIAMEIEADPHIKALFAKGIESARIGLPPKIRKMIEEHWEKYKSLGFMYYGTPHPAEHYYRELAEYFASGKNAADEFEQVDEVIEEHREKKMQLEARLGFDEYHRQLFAAYAQFRITKWYRRFAQIKSLYHADALLQEIGDRLGISNHQTRCMTFEEMKAALLEGKIDRELLLERTKFCTLYVQKGFTEVLVGDEAHKLAQSAEVAIDLDARELIGQCASLGSARGAVKIVLCAADMAKMNKGDILVAYATNPDVVPAMKKAAAIVTDQGGVTCHAAIVSRELGIPCVIGTKIATKVLHDGDIVEVDAANGTVRKTSL
ncbi:MAG: PEP-utilizing enzyme [Candidatus Micrarchaeota archaeon]